MNSRKQSGGFKSHQNSRALPRATATVLREVTARSDEDPIPCVSSAMAPTVDGNARVRTERCTAGRQTDLTGVAFKPAVRGACRILKAIAPQPRLPPAHSNIKSVISVLLLMVGTITTCFLVLRVLQATLWLTVLSVPHGPATSHFLLFPSPHSRFNKASVIVKKASSTPSTSL